MYVCVYVFIQGIDKKVIRSPRDNRTDRIITPLTVEDRHKCNMKLSLSRTLLRLFSARFSCWTLCGSLLLSHSMWSGITSGGTDLCLRVALDVRLGGGGDPLLLFLGLQIFP
jgi:hypothetical protein